MIHPINDGVTHINVYSGGQTKLGKFLSNFSDCNVETEDGPFRTIEGYWYWLSVKDDRLRTTSGWESKKLGRDLRGQDWNSSPDFQRKILKAICTKIISNKQMAEELKNSTLPLVHYYLFNAKVVEVKDGLWILTFLEHLREDLKNGLVLVP